MDIPSLRRRIEHLIHTDSSVFAGDILRSGFKCTRCGWCCQENFHIRVTVNISRPSNAISIFPEDIKRIVKGTGMLWHEIVQPDIYSCVRDGDRMWATGWILKRNDKGDCLFYGDGACSIYRWRPMICRCYPFFMDDLSVDIMHCSGLGNRNMTDVNRASRMGLLLKRYEIKKLQNYINVIQQMEDILDLSKMCSLPPDYSGTVLVCDGNSITTCRLVQCDLSFDQEGSG